jgi:hypothetical protein
MTTRMLSMGGGDDDEGVGADGGGGSSGSIDGPFLDGDTYLKAEYEFLGPDGSLYLDDGGGDRRDRSPRGGRVWEWEGGVGSRRDWQLGAPPAAMGGLSSQAPSYYYVDPPDDDDDDNPDDYRSTSSVARRQSSDERSPSYRSIEESEGGGAGDEVVESSFVEDSKTLHERVFEEERAYLEQSEGFRKMLSAMSDNEYDDESPMAKSRREEIERYNESVIDKLIREIDEMEDLAVSREEAMGCLVNNDEGEGKGGSLSDDGANGVSNERGRRRDDDVRCSKCGLRVTPDMIQRAEAIEIISNMDGNGRGGGGAKGVGGEGALVRRRYGNDVSPSGGSTTVCCSACYGMRFRTTNEATVRTAIWSGGGGSPSSFVGGRYNSSSSSKMFDGKRNDGDGRKSWSNNQRYDGGKEKWNKNRNTNTVQGISTSSLFDMPERGYNSEMKGRSSQPPKVPNDDALSNTPGNPNVRPPERDGSTPDYRRRRSFPPRRTSSIVGGGGELARRMQRDAESRNEDDSVERRTQTGRTFETGTSAGRITTTSNNWGEDDGVSLGGAITGRKSNGHTPNTNDDDGADEKTKTNTDVDQCWIKVEDPDSKRILYWNTDTGEMKNMM